MFIIIIIAIIIIIIIFLFDQYNYYVYYDYLSYYSYSGPNSLTQFGNTFYNTWAPGGFYFKRQWEQTVGYNVGADYGFVDNRISGSVDFYLRKTKQLLNNVSQAAGTNFSAYRLDKSQKSP